MKNIRVFVNNRALVLDFIYIILNR